MAGDVDRAIVYGQRALALAATLGHVGLQARTHLILGRAYYDAGDYARAVESLGGMWRPSRELCSLNALALMASSRHLPDLAEPLPSPNAVRSRRGSPWPKKGSGSPRPSDHPFSLIVACYGVSVVYLRQGDVHRAIPVLERAMGLCQDSAHSALVLQPAAALGLAYALDGRVAAGLALVEHGVEQAVARGRPTGLALLVAWLSEAYLLAGRLEEAQPTRRAGRRSRPRPVPATRHQAWALWLLGESTARQASPEVEPAAGHYRQALALAEELGMRPLQAHCHRGLGTLYARQGQQGQARTALSAAIAVVSCMDMRFWLPQAEAVLAQMI